MQVYALEAFAAVARLGTLTKAARYLHLTQPSVSARLRSLEEAVGGDLFDREGRRLRLSRAGEALLPFAEQALRSILQGQNAVTTALHSGRPSVITVGAPPTLSVYFLPRLAELWYQRHHLSTGTQLVLRTVLAPEVRELLLQQEIDMALTWLQPEDPDLHEELVTVDPVLFFVPAGHPLDRPGGVCLHDLHGQTLLHWDRAAIGWKMSEVECISATEWQLHPFLKCDHVEVAKRVRRLSNALARGPLLAFRPELESKEMKIIEVAGVRPSVRQVFLVTEAREGGPVSEFSLLKGLCHEQSMQSWIPAVSS